MKNKDHIVTAILFPKIPNKDLYRYDEYTFITGKAIREGLRNMKKERKNMTIPWGSVTPEIKNARIESTMLGTGDRGILTYMIRLDYSGAGQGFGGYVLDDYDEAKKERIGTAYGMETIKRILEVLEVEKWEDLRGKPCRVLAEHSKVHKIGHYLKDKWFDPVALGNEFIDGDKLKQGKV